MGHIRPRKGGRGNSGGLEKNPRSAKFPFVKCFPSKYENLRDVCDMYVLQSLNNQIYILSVIIMENNWRLTNLLVLNRTRPEINFAPVPEPPVKFGTETGTRLCHWYLPNKMCLENLL